MTERKKKSLGRGLSALLGEINNNSSENTVNLHQRIVPIADLQSGKYQPRKILDDESLKELANSVREKGILQPIIVRNRLDDPKCFEIIAGERRWRAAQLAQLHEVPNVVKNFNDQECLEIALIENLQREDLSPLEEAKGYQRLLDEFGHTQEILARGISKSRSHVTNMIRLLNLPEEIKTLLDEGRITMGHARSLLMARNPIALSKQVIEKNLTVRKTEKLAKTLENRDPDLHGSKRDPNLEAMETGLENLLGIKVTITSKGNSGSLTLKFSNLEQLDNLLMKLGFNNRIS